MPYTIETKNNQAIFTLTISKEKVEQAMKESAQNMADESSIPGFRAGKAPYDVVKQRIGEMKILENAAEQLIRGAFYEAMLEEKIEIVGQPFFEVEKMAPENEMIIKATVSLYPKTHKLADYTKLSVKKAETTPSEAMIKQAKKDLTKMQTKEIRKSKEKSLEKGDKAVIHLVMKKDGVVIDGGEAPSHAIYTGEDYYIQGMAEKLTGAKEGDKLNFTLPFPKDHYQKHLAGQDVDFEVKVNEIHELQAPVINDEFAKSLGLKDAEDLESKITENLRLENESEEQVRQEQACLDLLVENSEFDEIPELLVNQEINKMLGELEHTLVQRGMKMEEYLASIHKSIAELKIDFTPTAIKRIKAALVIKEIAKKENVNIEDDVLDKEIDHIAEHYQEEEAKKAIFEPRFREYVREQLLVKKTVEVIKTKMVN